jgi:hypothetical protein
MTNINAELRTEGFPDGHAVWHTTPDGDKKLLVLGRPALAGSDRRG